jgi:2-iminoacetate synthase
MSFKDVFEGYSWDQIKADIYSRTDKDVEKALYKDGKRDLEDFKSLISPAATPYLEQMAQMSRAITQKRFGKIVQLYIPLYLSNECQNICTYCGFSFTNKVKRVSLSDAQIIQEAKTIRAHGFEHVLLVTGESGQVGVPYIKNAIGLLRQYFAQISIEVQPLDEPDYAELIREGLHTVLVYQETYHQEKYKMHHPKGKKSNFDYRLDTPDRLGNAGIHKIGLGILIGLEDWRTDSFFTALHLDYLEKTYWQTRFSLSFPRLRPHSGAIAPVSEMSDRELVQLICAYRIFNEDVELSLSTRESEKFRNHAVKLGITSMSAGSKTNPGGYSLYQESLEQFEISDERAPAEVASMLRQEGFDPVWKDWDFALN